MHFLFFFSKWKKKEETCLFLINKLSHSNTWPGTASKYIKTLLKPIFCLKNGLENSIHTQAYTVLTIVLVV